MKYINNLPTKGKYQCEVCGRWINKRREDKHLILCQKHEKQLKKYGNFLDSNPRSTKDLNNYMIENERAIGTCYNLSGEPIGTFTFDTEDLPKVRYHKWRLSRGKVVTGKKNNNTERELAWAVLGVHSGPSKHIVYLNGNPRDNRKVNLKIEDNLWQ